MLDDQRFFQLPHLNLASARRFLEMNSSTRLPALPPTPAGESSMVTIMRSLRKIMPFTIRQSKTHHPALCDVLNAKGAMVISDAANTGGEFDAIIMMGATVAGVLDVRTQSFPSRNWQAKMLKIAHDCGLNSIMIVHNESIPADCQPRIAGVSTLCSAESMRLVNQATQKESAPCDIVDVSPENEHLGINFSIPHSQHRDRSCF